LPFVYIFFFVCLIKYILFKVEAKTDPSIKFVDVINNLEAYVRCDCSETAKMIAEENRWPQTSQLKGKYISKFRRTNIL